MLFPLCEDNPVEEFRQRDCSPQQLEFLLITLVGEVVRIGRSFSRFHLRNRSFPMSWH